jgi:hypothetical protein
VTAFTHARTAGTWHEQYGDDDAVRYTGAAPVSIRGRRGSYGHSAAPFAAAPAPATEDPVGREAFGWEGLDDSWMADGLCRQAAWRTAAMAFDVVGSVDKRYPNNPARVTQRYARPNWLAKSGDGGSGTYAGRAALRVCALCPVRAECLNYALAAGLDLDVWGGTTPEERAGLAADRAPARTLC